MVAIREFRINDPSAKSNQSFASNRVSTTKYTPLNFILYFALNELGRPANIFFIIIAIAQQFDPTDPSKYTTILPLSIVLGFSALKEIYEDTKRWYMDDQANHQKVEVVRDGKLTQVRCESVRVGDIVRVKKEERFPADLVLLSSSEPQGMAYLETSNVDGESNLKIRMSNPRTIHLIDEQSLSAFQATVKCETPNERIYNFEGNIDNGTECFSLDNSNLLLRGACLKNTSWIYGIAVYTGHETKIMMNASGTPNKRTQMQHHTDENFYCIAFGLTCLCLIGLFGNWYYDTQILPDHWYLNPLPNKTGIKLKWNVYDIIFVFFKFLMLLNTLIPISMSVTLETIKLVMAFLVNQDLELYDAENDCRAVARSSNLMEELGQIQCILTDKTGTLTCNEMILRHLIIDGEIYLDCKELGSKVFELSQQSDNNVDFFLKILSTCHTVMIDYSDPENPCFQGSSPDELAMVNVASALNYKFAKRSSGSITIEIRGQNVEIEVFAVIEFTSARKRMSIVALMPDNNYYLFCKGADSIILERLESESANSKAVKKSLKGLEEFASAGLRTLCFAYRRLDKDFALEWLDKWHDALETVTNRQEKIDSVAELIETEMKFIGATGVEDRLQEGVPETIETLTKANIKIWMLTGDRFETAISTAFLSSLIQASTIQLHLLQADLDSIHKSIDNFLDLISKSGPNSNFALVVNGAVVEIILSETFLKSPESKMFRRVLNKCRTLLCCRLSPLQKSQITKYAREQLGYVTLAIGDGGNDVSMIQASNVGVGISGKEGLQASRCADFSIAQFKFLIRLVLVHGSWSLHRLSRVIMYSIYKNFVLFFTQFWFNFYNTFSAETFFEPWMYVLWNIVFTCWPPTMIGLTDQYVMASELVQNPQLYEFGQKNKFYDRKTFWESGLNAIFHSFIIFASLIILFPEGFLFEDQRVSTSYMYGSLGFAIILSVVSMKILLFTNYLTWILALSVIVSSGVWYFFVPLTRYVLEGYYNASSLELFSHPVFWACVFLIPVLVLARDFIWKFYRRQFSPHPYHIVQELKLTELKKGTAKGGPETTNLIIDGPNRKPRRSRGFSFSQTYGQTRVLQAYGQSPRLASSVVALKVHSDDL